MIVARPPLEQRVLQALDAGRIPVLLGGCGSGRTSVLLRLTALLGDGRAQYIDVSAAATTPERCLQAVVTSAAPADAAPPTPVVGARAAFDALLSYFDGASAPGNGPVTFLCDEILDIRTFESFPGLRHVQRELIDRLADTPNGFVLASRFTARAHRLLRDATARFEVIHIPACGADDVRGLLALRKADDALTQTQCAAVAALSGGRAAYASLLLDVLLSQPAARRNPVYALVTALSPDGVLAARCRESYEFRLHRARGYGALKAILSVLADEESLTLTEISQRLHRTPGSTKDYLSWLEDVDLVVMQRKRYVFDDALLRVYVGLYGGPTPPTAADVTAAVAQWAAQCLPDAAPASEAVLATAGPDRSGIIEID